MSHAVPHDIIQGLALAFPIPPCSSRCFGSSSVATLSYWASHERGRPWSRKYAYASASICYFCGNNHSWWVHSRPFRAPNGRARTRHRHPNRADTHRARYSPCKRSANAARFSLGVELANASVPINSNCHERPVTIHMRHAA